MEYSFRNSAGEAPVAVHLRNDHMLIRRGEHETTIPYDKIGSVTLRRNSGKSFQMKIHADDASNLIITNRFVDNQGRSEDRSRQYHAFARVLHFHLKDKSHASFYGSNSWQKLSIWIVVAGFIAFLISFVTEFLGASIINPFAQAGAITVGLSAVLVFIKLRTNRVPYTPEEIPTQFLPPVLPLLCFTFNFIL